MTQMILFLDVETTGLPKSSLPDADPRQPHLVEVAATLVDAANNTLGEMSRIVRPDGWRIGADTVAIHGITTEHAMEKGRFAGDVLHELLRLARASEAMPLLVAHNVAFDHHMIRIALARFLPIERPWWNLLPRFCTMEGALRVCDKGKLAVAYELLCDQVHGTKHEAIGDVDACRGIYFELLRRQQRAVGL